MYYDVPGRTRHPFNTLSSFVASPLADSVQLGYVDFDFSSTFTFNYSNRTLTSLSVDFGNGSGLQMVNLGNIKSVYYGSTGYKILKFVATFSNSTSITTYAALKIFGNINDTQLRGANNCAAPTPFTLWSKLSFQGYDESTATKGYGDVTVYHSAINNCDGIIRKPIIIIDGFDPQDRQNGVKLYDDYLNNDQKGKLGDSLRNRGYDIFILNFPEYEINGKARDGGADYIERNARVLMALIDTVNAMKQGNEKLVIIGPSMGGLISRYALAYMEQHNMPHNTRLWISFDSPHQGANIPIGDQRWLDFYGRKTGSEDIISKRDGKIGSVAAKQMLISHYLSTSSGGAPGFRNQFLSNINALGFPVGDAGQPFRKIALIDGSLGGTEINSPGQKGFTFDVRRWHSIDLWLFKIRYKTFTVASARMYFTPSYGGQNTVFDGSFLNKSEANIVSAPSSSSGIDVAPGGKFDTQKQIADGGDDQLIHFLGANPHGGLRFKTKFYSVVPDHSFINTKSALAFSGTNQNLSENISNRSLVCTGETPFDSYFGDFNTNRDHVELWAPAINYILKEIDGIPQLPLIKSNLTIAGPAILCDTAVYTINSLPSDVNPTWNIEGSGAVIISSTGNQVIVAREEAGVFKIIANIQNDCSKYDITSHSITSGFPYYVAIQEVHNDGMGTPFGTLCSDSPDYDNYYNVFNYTISPNAPFPVNLTYRLWDDNGLVLQNSLSINASTGTIKLPGYQPNGGYSLDATISGGSCNLSSEVAETYLYYETCNPHRTIVAYPNPANTEIKIAYQEENANDVKNVRIIKSPGFSIKLFNDKGVQKSLEEKSTDGSSIILPTMHLPNGTYFLHILKEKEIVKKQIIIQH